MAAGYLKMLSKMDKLPIHTDIETLDIYCEYLLNDSSKYINYSNLTNLSDYINMMDTKMFMTNDSKMARYEFIRLYLEARNEHGILSRKMILKYINENLEPRYKKIVQREILNSIEPDQLSKKDIEFINNLIFAQLNVVFLHEYKAPISKLFEDLDSNIFGRQTSDCNDAIQLFQRLLTELTKAQRRSKQDNRFNLTDAKHFKAIMTEGINRLLSEAQYWQTGMQGLNSMLGGGFENSRIYNFIGATGGFKSGLLLNLWKQVKMYNRGHEHKDPTKRPTVLFLSQENNIWETLLRIFGIFGTTQNIKNFTPDKIMEILEKGGFKVCVDELDIDLEFRYYGNMDIGVNDIRGIVEELDNQGREVIGVFQDYIERLRPPMMNVDRRQQLNDISNQMHDLAIDLDIWIVTGSQFNREGVSIIEDMRESDKYDIGRKVGSKNISESFGMLKNFDVNISIVVEYDSKEERFWLSFRALKFRGDDTDNISYFLQPFVGTNSKIRLAEDVNGPAAYRTTMADEDIAMLSDSINEMTKVSKKPRTIFDPVTMDTEDADIIDFFGNITNDLAKPNSEKEDGVWRDADGFMILIRTPECPIYAMEQALLGKSYKAG